MLNPVENLFSEVKAEVRNMLSESEGEYSLKNLIETEVGTVTQSDCANYVLNMSRNLSIAAAGQPMEL